MRTVKTHVQNGRVPAVADVVKLPSAAVEGVRGFASADAADVEKVERTVLPNGLTVLSEFIPGIRSVSLGAWVQAATLHEKESEMGISHMLEHLVFKGTERRTSKEISFALETLGGSLDAYTAREHTSYQALFLNEHLDTAADVLHDVMFAPALRDNDLQLEKKVIVEEIAMVEDTPDDIVFDIHNELLWGNNGYGFEILGTRETVDALTLKDLAKLHADAYHAENVVVAAAGAIHHDDLLESLVAHGWGDVTRKGKREFEIPVVDVLPPAYKHVNREGAQTHIVLGSRLFSCLDPRRHAHSLVSMLLGGGMSSRLFQRVREELGLAYSVYSFSTLYGRDGMHGIYVGTGPDTANDAVEAILEELNLIAESGIPEDELQAGKRQLKGQITLSLESPSARMYRAAGLELYREPYRPLDETLALIDAIDGDTVSAVCKDYFAPHLHTVVSLGPAPVDCLSKV